VIFPEGAAELIDGSFLIQGGLCFKTARLFEPFRCGRVFGGPCRLRVFAMALQDLSDESILKLYESIRQQVSADVQAGGRYRLLGETAKEQAQRLRGELERRRLSFAPIDWP
jgi:hypothetical protein